MAYERCMNCSRPLTDQDSRRIGFGAECADKLRQQAVWVGAAKQAIATGATDDSKLIVLGRILKRHESNLLRYSEEEVVPEVIVKSLRQVRHDFEQRARYLNRMGFLFVPEVEIQISEVAAAA